MPGLIDVLLTFVTGVTLTVVIDAVLDVLVDAIFTGFTVLRGRAILFLTAAFILAGFFSTDFFFGVPTVFSLTLRDSFALAVRIIPFFSHRAHQRGFRPKGESHGGGDERYVRLKLFTGNVERKQQSR